MDAKDEEIRELRSLLSMTLKELDRVKGWMEMQPEYHLGVPRIRCTIDAMERLIREQK